ncbi:hypothetical protein hp2018_0558 [Helicobacter pylori 2018]|nr:hypothetical protein hp2017_0556 [Helicobacter pylori 2017]ADZ51252.1 hypothetical protein hp2018_0558 [Helicobacter pylori 2018]
MPTDKPISSLFQKLFHKSCASSHASPTRSKAIHIPFFFHISGACNINV